MEYKLSDGYKSIDFSAWGGIDNFLALLTDGNTTQIARMRQIVPWLNKGVVMTANATAQMPYKITDGDKAIDKSLAWGGVKNPQTLMYKLAASLCGGAAYALIDATDRAIVAIDYVVPQTMTPIYNSAGEVVNFKRQINGRSQTLSPEQVLYIWYPDETVETGPAQIYPLKNAILAAGILSAMDNTLRTYGERGFIPPILLAVKGQTSAADKEKAEAWWNAFLRGWTKTVSKIINAETVTPTVLGAGMNEMRGAYNEIASMQIKNIATSFNIPTSLFLGDAANYATMGGERRTWYETGVLNNIYQSIEDAFTEQIFSRYGRKFEYMPEALDAFQDDENAKSGSFAAIASTIAANPDAAIIAADILRYDLTPAQIDAIESISGAANAQIDAPTPAQTFTQKKYNADEDNAIADELMKWQRFAERGLGKKKRREFDVKYIPPALALTIKSKLLDADTPEKIALVFAGAADELPIIQLARAIENNG